LKAAIEDWRVTVVPQTTTTRALLLLLLQLLPRRRPCANHGSQRSKEGVHRLDWQELDLVDHSA
jgi:hypothetical protein